VWVMTGNAHPLEKSAPGIEDISIHRLSSSYADRAPSVLHEPDQISGIRVCGRILPVYAAVLYQLATKLT